MVFFGSKRSLRLCVANGDGPHCALKVHLNHEYMKTTAMTWELTVAQGAASTMHRAHCRTLQQNLEIALHFTNCVDFLTRTRQPLTALCKYRQSTNNAGNVLGREKKRNEIRIEVRRPRRTFRVTFHPFEPLCQLKRLCEQNLWPVEMIAVTAGKYSAPARHLPPCHTQAQFAFVSRRRAHQFHAFGQFFFSESLLSCLIWCLRPLKT